MAKGSPCSDPLIGANLDAQDRRQHLLHIVVISLDYTCIGVRSCVDLCPGHPPAMWALQYDGDVGWGFVPAADQAAGFDAFPHFLKKTVPGISLADSNNWRITHCLLHHFDAGNIHDSDLALIDFLETALNLSPLPLDGAGVRATHGE